MHSHGMERGIRFHPFIPINTNVNTACINLTCPPPPLEGRQFRATHPPVEGCEPKRKCTADNVGAGPCLCLRCHDQVGKRHTLHAQGRYKHMGSTITGIHGGEPV